MTSATNLGLGLVALVTAPLVARVLGPSGRGTLVTVQLLPQFLGDLSALGLGFALVHHGSARPGSLGQLWRWTWAPTLVGVLVMSGIGHGLAGVITASPSDETMMRVYLLVVPIVGFTAVAQEALRALGDYRRWNMVTVARRLAWPFALLVGVLRPDPSLWLVVWIHLGLSAVILVFVMADVARRLRPLREPPVVGRWAHIRFGVASALSTVPRSANAKLDQLVMAATVTTVQLGRYAAAVGWSQVTLPVMRGLAAVTMPHVSSARGADERVRRTRQLVTYGLSVVVVVGLAALVVTAVVWHPLYGDKYRSAFAAALILVPAALLLELNAVLSNVLRSLGRPWVVAVLEGLVLTGSIAALLIVVRVAPVTGAAVVSLATYTTGALLYGYWIARELSVPFRSLVSPGEAGRQARRLLARVREATAT
ncbi:MAG: lipopolysaccharide biosynthesis protein [Actinomyces sp.]|nr:MAG: lipopolysaccharide biosynthesis protein [Actinomyces sp.]